MSLLFALQPSRTSSAPAPAASAPAATQQVLKVIDRGAHIDIADPGLHFSTGDQLPLFQRNGEYFLGIHQSQLGPPTLCAFPRSLSRNRATAWVANKKNMVFGYSSGTVPGKFFFYIGEELNVLKNTPEGFHVILERFGYRIPFVIPAITEGLLLEDRAVTGTVVATPPQTAPGKVSAPGDPVPLRVTPALTRPRMRPTEPETRDDLATPLPVVAPVETPSSPDPVPAEVIGSVAPVMDAAPSVVPVPVPEPAVTRPLELPPSAPMIAVPDEPVASPAPEPDAVEVLAGLDVLVTRVLDFLDRHSLTSQLLLLVCLLEALFYTRLKHRRRVVPAPVPVPVPAPVVAEAAVAEPVVPPLPELGTPWQPEEAGDVTLHGSLEGFNIGQVVQFFHTSAETGVLVISGPNGREPDKLVFRKGRMVDALAEGMTGEDAARYVLRRKLGQFSFKREEVDGTLDTINQDTMSLLLECHRLVDEEGYVDDGESGREAYRVRPTSTALDLPA